MKDNELAHILPQHAGWSSGAALQAEQRADFRAANLLNMNFEGADLRFADFRAANCSGVNFSRADCRHADFRGANLHAAVCIGTNFSNARFEGATLTGIDCRTAKLDFAQMAGADLGDHQVQHAAHGDAWEPDSIHDP